MVALEFYMNMYKRCNFSTTVVFHIYNMYSMHIQYTLTPVHGLPSQIEQGTMSMVVRVNDMHIGKIVMRMILTGGVGIRL